MIKGANVIVIKSGGEVNGSRQLLTNVVSAIRCYLSRGFRVVQVVSAPDGATDLLKEAVRCRIEDNDDVRVEAAQRAVRDRYVRWLQELALSREVFRRLHEELDELVLVDSDLRGLADKRRIPELMDRALALGEKMAAKVVAAFLNGQDVDARACDVSRGALATNDRFGDADPHPEAYDRLRNVIADFFHHGAVPVVTGFIGCTFDGGCVTTLGRSGTDYTATIVASALGESTRRVEIWKKDPLSTGDPRKIPETVLLSVLNYEQASELAAGGMKAVHPRAVKPLREHGIPLIIRSAACPLMRGTRIHACQGSNGIAGVALLRGQVLITLSSESMVDAPGPLAEGARALQESGLDIGLVSSGWGRFSFSTHGREVGKVLSLFPTGLAVQTEPDCAIVTVVGSWRGVTPRVLARVMDALDRAHVVVHSHSMAGGIAASVPAVSCQIVVPDTQAELAARAIHRALFKNKARSR